MPFVKLDCDMLLSSIWTEKDQRDVFITALLMAEPYEVREPEPQLCVERIKETGWEVPVGWYGMIPACGGAIVHQAMVDPERGMLALEKLGEPDSGSKSKAYDGRRLVRINGGYIALNYIEYRDRDYTSAQRSKRWRERQKKKDESVEKAAKKRAGGGTIRTHHVEPAKEPPIYTRAGKYHGSNGPVSE